GEEIDEYTARDEEGERADARQQVTLEEGSESLRPEPEGGAHAARRQKDQGQAAGEHGIGRELAACIEPRAELSCIHPGGEGRSRRDAGEAEIEEEGEARHDVDGDGDGGEA